MLVLCLSISRKIAFLVSPGRRKLQICQMITTKLAVLEFICKTTMATGACYGTLKPVTAEISTTTYGITSCCQPVVDSIRIPLLLAMISSNGVIIWSRRSHFLLGFRAENKFQTSYKPKICSREYCRSKQEL